MVCLGILSAILESHEEDHVCILGDIMRLYITHTPRYNEICDMLYENNIMFRDKDIIPDNTCTFTYVNNCSQIC